MHLASLLGKKYNSYCLDAACHPNVLFVPLCFLTCSSYSAALADIMLKEKLHIFGILGCVLCVVGSTTIVLHAPQERAIESVAEVWDLATEPGTPPFLPN